MQERELQQIVILFVPPHHHQKIDLAQEYPCPCHLDGKLQQIVLTEAFGCDRCHRIFVMQADGLTIEELATTYPYKRRYYWNGKRLQILRSLPKIAVWPFTRQRDGWVIWLPFLSIIAVVAIGFQLYSRTTLTNPIFNLVLSMAIAIVVLTVITLWLFDQG
jgi:hypothetical protein